MPGKSSNVLESSDFLISKVGDDFEHLSTISIKTINLIHDFWLGEYLPIEHIADDGGSDEVLGLHHVAHD